MTRLLVEHLQKSFPAAGEPLHVLRDICMEVSGGQSLAIVGPSGSGKSTLLQILGTLDRPDGGTVKVDGEDPFLLDQQQVAHWRNQKVGFIFQDHHLLPHLSVMENVLIPTLAGGRANAPLIERAKELLQAVGLSDRVGHLPGMLSGGERERVAIARALLMSPSLILADEPTGNLDRRTAEAVTEVLQSLQRDNNAILICVTHSETLAAAMDQRHELLDGKLVRS
ncbi:ABC transporter ATP-binding protein [Roseiconus lacunae]|uniref:ABC transporter ATP-binding protein n=1 Tax=Roseiconus lacunae TaxID=2605694 RepID=A0ABT7PKE7_9BACT|nr:ABC transporter ATP-binding protein [Roseiconus lacunae]MCD0461074.1 ABC transporter ATP-binding protein [Roseiconus lacunae]MDM4016978.1 ABC transporter ATP-binding protein [Roseiconus lacunae]WRQ48912.1 ABC transporter ATP-binding protein [Stieleria sp. HD01]